MRYNEMSWAQLRHRLDAVLDEAMQADGSASGKIRVLDPETGELRICAHRGLSPTFLERYFRTGPEGDTVCAEALRRRRRVVVPDLGRDGRHAELAAHGRDSGFKGLQSTPIVAPDGQVVGTLSTLFGTSYQPSKSVELVLDYCARRAAGIIDEMSPASS